MKKKTHEEYVKELLEKGITHIPLEFYINSRTKILHECAAEKHQWAVKPHNVLKGNGCPLCATPKKKTNSQYLADLLAKGINYRPVEPYKGSRIKILHKCSIKEHPEWLVRPDHVLEGYGCPVCSKSGFDPAKPGKLYFIKFEFEKEIFFKVGITNLTAEKRLSADWKRLKMQLLWEIDYEVGADARETEKKILADNKDFLVNTKALKSGNTETFSIFINPPKVASLA
jgi:hypothetical protein